MFMRADALVQKFLGASGHGHTGQDGDGDLIDLTSAVTGVLSSDNLSNTVVAWDEFTLSASSFSTASTVNHIELFELEQTGMIETVIIKHSQHFRGGAISAYTLDVGPTANFVKYVDTFSTYQTVAASAYISESIAPDPESFSAATSIRVRARSTGANLSAAASGVVKIWIKRSSLI